MPKVHRLGDLVPNDCLVLRTIRAEHKNWNWHDDHGYIKYYSPGYKSSVFEHRLVAARAFGVELDPRIHVHHKNEAKRDNRADNLELLSITEHASLHHRDKIETTCTTCRKTIYCQPSKFKRHKSHYCSNDCKYADQLKFRKAARPSHQELKRLIAEINNFCELGRMFGVSDNAVRKWARSYGIPLAKQKGRLTGVGPATS